MGVARLRGAGSGFSLAVLGLVGVGACALVGGSRQYSGLPALPGLLPTLLLGSLGAQCAGSVLVGILFLRGKELAPVVLVGVSSVSAVLEISTYATTPLSLRAEPFITGSRQAGPWSVVMLHLLAAAGFALYRWVCVRRIGVEPATNRRILAATVVCSIGFAFAVADALVHFGDALPHLVAGVDRSGYRTSGVGFLVLAASLAALLTIPPAVRATAFDKAIALTLLTNALLAGVGLLVPVRFSIAWFVSTGLLFGSSTFIAIAAIIVVVETHDRALRADAERVRADALGHELNAAVETSVLKSRFVATVSHELRTPLNGIIGTTELLELTVLDERQRGYATTIRTSAEGLFRIVNDILDFSRAEAGKLEISEDVFDVHALVDDVATLFAPQAHGRSIILITYIDPSLPRMVVGDPMRIRQILHNLLSNAIRFTSVGGVRLEASAVVPHTGDRETVSFAVHDTGIGIPAAAQPRIFEAFSQADASTARRHGGTGLGLAIARHLTELMGGTLTMQSLEGAGSTFVATVQVGFVDEHSVRWSPLRDIRALIIEGDANVRELLERYLTGWEMQGTAAGAAPQALDELGAAVQRLRPFDIAIVGPTVELDEALAFGAAVRAGAGIGNVDLILLRESGAPDIAERAQRAGYGFAVVGTVRQSSLFDAICRLRRRGFDNSAREALDTRRVAPARGERILVVEDNEVNQTLLRAQLSHLGFSCACVNDGRAAVAAAANEPFDLIFMDCQMPEMDGFEAARRIRGMLTKAQRPPIVAITANAMPGYRETCLAAGMDDYLTKPVLLAPLAALLERWLPSSSGAGDAGAPAAAPAAPELDGVLLQRLEEIFGGNASSIADFLSVAVTSLHESLRALDAAIDDHDAVKLAEAAHRMRGVALELSLEPIVAATSAIESDARAGQLDHAMELVPPLRAAVESLAVARVGPSR